MRFVVTAGPTREAIDPVRFISNRSSGKMGYAIAEAAIAAGHDVTLISGPASLAPPESAQLHFDHDERRTAREVHRAVRDCDVLVMCAAVSDYKPATVRSAENEKTSDAFHARITSDARHSRLAPAGESRFSSSSVSQRRRTTWKQTREKTSREKLRHDRRERCQQI